MRFTGRAILLDIEGTISPIRFVYDVLFPYARRYLTVFLRQLWNNPAMPELREAFAKQAGAKNFEEWTGGFGVPPERQLETLRFEALKLMDADSKSTPLKELQGMIWKEGYDEGTLRSEVFPDVISAFLRWKNAGQTLAIYSSGSVTAQKIFFQFVNQEEYVIDLNRYLQSYYDTTTGPKREAASYLAISQNMQIPPGDILFLSDIVAELDAARSAGMKTGLMNRPGNASIPQENTHPLLHSFEEIQVG